MERRIQHIHEEVIIFEETGVVRRLCATIGLTITVAVLLFGCGPSPAVRQFQQQIAQTKQQCKAAEVRRAVLLLKDRWDDRDSRDIARDQWPNAIRGIALFPDYVDYLYPSYFETSTGTNALGLIAGGGFGHWGIIVCIDTNSVPKAEGTVVPWEAGVFFWLE